MITTIPLQASEYYHIYNHANGSDNLFFEKDNYWFFLKKWDKHISPIANTMAYCLMPNHFHALIKIKDPESLAEKIINQEKNFNTKPIDKDYISKYLSQQFSNLFNGYTKAINKRFKRYGSLFNPRFKRKIIPEEHLIDLINYIHNNPVHHGFTTSIYDWPYSSVHLQNEEN